ncbi:MAG: hypothetical protein BVN35_01125 [Proteobacteria bacterium ST_bin11]|nr:MAG: hypothetical protein BVN35_01125 [Proteobacteria bacterium ST_bin11]
MSVGECKFGSDYYQGFTLIELVMVIVTLGILSATTLPKFFNLSLYQEKVFFDDTINAIRYAQKLAVKTGCNVQVQISTNQFELSRPSATDRSKCGSTADTDFDLAVARPGSGESSYQGSQAGIALTNTTFYFSAKGNASADQHINVGSNGRQISVVADTGFVYDSSS